MQSLHRQFVHSRRVHRIASRLADCVPEAARVLDVGAGDGALARLLLKLRPDLRIQGVDVLLRPLAEIPVQQFDGQQLPFEDRFFDAVMLVDVLHHAEDPAALFAECVRVSRQCLLIKDHLADRWLANPTLRFMDWVGNASYGVALPYHYWRQAQWQQQIAEHQLQLQTWTEDLRLYPWPADLLFGRGLHFIARLDRNASEPQ